MRFFAASILWCICAFAQAPDVKPDDKCSVEARLWIRLRASRSGRHGLR
jgi:hypothetical protein